MSGIIGGAGSKSGVIGDNDLKQYDMTVTHTTANVWATTSSVVIPYKTSNGNWWVKGNIIGTVQSGNYGSNNVIQLTTTGVTWILRSAFTVMHNDAQSTNINGQGYFETGGMIVLWNGILNPESIWSFSFDVRVASKPTWAD